MTAPRGAFDRQSAYAQLYAAMQSDRPLEDRLREALEIGVEQFGVDLGYVAEVDQATNDWEIIISTDPEGRPNPTGLQEDLTNTFCLRTIKNEEIIAFRDVVEEGLEDHPSAVEYDISCYHGAPIIVDGEPYGTVCFSSFDPRDEAFSDAEKSFSHLVAQMAGYEIEQQAYEAELTDRETTLDERGEIYRAVIDASFDQVFRLDTEGRFIYNSESVTALLGYKREELDGEPVSVLHPDEEAVERGMALFERVLAGETVEDRYFPLESKAGDIIYVDVRGTPIYDSQVPTAERTPEDIVAVQGMIRDATDRKRRDGLISVINRVLRHNLRNDVGVINGYAEMLEDDLTGQQELLAKRVRTTSGRLLDLSETAQKLEANLDLPDKRQSLDLCALANRVVDQHQNAYPGASIEVSAPEQVVVESSPRLETALWELVDNAAKHAGETPAVSIEIEQTETHVVCTVRDDGPGIPELERSVLESGEETSLVHGRGLGLWLVYWIVTGLDGSVSVVDAHSGGSTVQLRLPQTSTD